jgi:predicted  nucleic acid-binding Zn-ribbon protein
MIMIMTNDEIYTHTRQLMDAFQDGEQRLPIKVNFYLQKNKNTLLALAQDIEKARIEIAQTYGTLDESGEQYQIPEEKLADASKELEDLFNLEQDVNIYTISIDSLSDDLTLTTAQMDAIMFMID